MSPKIAYLGMGAMGQAMSKNLVQKGNLGSPILLWNRTSSVSTEHAGTLGGDQAAVAVESVLDAVREADIIWSCLATQDAVLSVFDTILKDGSVATGKVFVESSTIEPVATNALAEKITAAGAEFVAMPVFGEPSMANAGVLTCVPAGPKAAVEKVLPYTKGVIARAVVDLSDEQPGSASHLKLIGNVLIVHMIEAAAEAHVLAAKSGLKNEVLDLAIGTMFPGPLAIYSKKMVTGAYHKEKPMVAIDMAIKVASHVLGLAERSGAELKAYKEGKKHLDMVKENAGPGGDIAGIYGAVRLESGLPYET